MLDIPRWVGDAECGPSRRNLDPELFFPQDGVVPREVIDACAACPVREECLAYSMQHEEAEPAGQPSRFGIWGGYVPRARTQLAKGHHAEPVFSFRAMEINRRKRREHAA